MLLTSRKEGPDPPKGQAAVVGAPQGVCKGRAVRRPLRLEGGRWKPSGKWGG